MLDQRLVSLQRAVEADPKNMPLRRNLSLQRLRMGGVQYSESLKKHYFYLGLDSYILASISQKDSENKDIRTIPLGIIKLKSSWNHKGECRSRPQKILIFNYDFLFSSLETQETLLLNKDFIRDVWECLQKKIEAEISSNDIAPHHKLMKRWALGAVMRYMQPMRYGAFSKNRVQDLLDYDLVYEIHKKDIKERFKFPDILEINLYCEDYELYEKWFHGPKRITIFSIHDLNKKDLISEERFSNSPTQIGAMAVLKQQFDQWFVNNVNFYNTQAFPIDYVPGASIR